MPYLTYDEYIDLGFPEIGEAEFNKLLPKASDVVDSVTRSFYKFNDMESDVPFRREMFKKAVAAQIEFFNELGSTTYESIKRIPQTFSAGRTSVTLQTGKAEGRSLVAEDVYIFLEGTGLLFAGVGVKM